ncbi:MAG TPA: mitochondrial fission ELM1 family protein [Alphaproteobacteria bacterium]|nr:mitochondrial fission ELM1 family protein [Alphaproteobacteria bacterium]
MTHTPQYNKNTKSPVVWVITEGLAGTENQCLGVAEALETSHEIKRISLTQPWAALSPWLGIECAATFCPRLEGPWPDLLIASGRKSIAASKFVKKQSLGKTFTVQLQDPRISTHHFNLVALPEHDPTRGDNVIVTKATPNRISLAKLSQAREEFAPFFENLKSPRIAVLIGGSTKTYTVHEKDIVRITQILKPLTHQASLMVTTSRRTGETGTQFLKKELESPNTFFWDGNSPNPYMGLLAWADIIIATNDSTSMLSEAATTGKPVYNIALVQLSKRQNMLLENLKSMGAIRDWQGTLETWSYEPLNDAAMIAQAIRQKSGLFAL